MSLVPLFLWHWTTRAFLERGWPQSLVLPPGRTSPNSVPDHVTPSVGPGETQNRLLISYGDFLHRPFQHFGKNFTTEKKKKKNHKQENLLLILTGRLKTYILKGCLCFYITGNGDLNKFLVVIVHDCGVSDPSSLRKDLLMDEPEPHKDTVVYLVRPDKRDLERGGINSIKYDQHLLILLILYPLTHFRRARRQDPIIS